MARCDIEGCDWYGKASGKAIHMAKVHGVHPVHDELESPPERLMEPIISRWSP